MPLLPQHIQKIQSLTPEQKAQMLQEVNSEIQLRQGGGVSAQPMGMGQRLLGGLMGGLRALPYAAGGKIMPKSELEGPEDTLRDFIIKEQIKKRLEPPQKWEPTTKEEALEFEKEKNSARGKNIADPTDLTSEQQIQARALSRKLYGVRGAEFGLPNIYEEMRKGKSIDEIEDSIRYAGQSPEFAGHIRNAAQTVLLGKSSDMAQTAMDYIDDLVSRGDTEGAKSQLKRLARQNTSMEESRNISGKERTIKLLNEIEDDLRSFAQAGGDTNIFTGGAEEIAAKTGNVIQPELRKIATKIATALQSYRRSMTGQQFGEPENLEYKIMFPNIKRTQNFNLANIDALREVLAGDLDNFYALSMGEDVYSNLFTPTYREKTGARSTIKSTLPEQDASILGLDPKRYEIIGVEK